MKNLDIQLTISVIILIGLLSTLAYSLSNNHELPFSNDGDVPSPYERITEQQIKVSGDKVIIEIPKANFAKYADTNSMDPVLDQGSIGIEVPVDSEEDIHLGDIITYQPEWSNDLVVHRVIAIGEDEQGWYAYTKGDNTTTIDPGKIRISQVKYLLVGVLY